MGKYKKVIYSFAILVLVSAVLFIYNEFNGNPISKYFSKRVLAEHLEETYPDKELVISDNGLYDFKFNDYVFTVREIGVVKPENLETKDYTFHVRGHIVPEVSVDGIRLDQLDVSVMERLGADAGDELLMLLREQIPTVRAVEVYIEVLKGQLEEDVKWSKDLPFDNKMRLHIVLDATNSSKEEVFKEILLVQEILDNEGYDYDYVNINANYLDSISEKDAEHGYVKYGIAFDKGQSIQLKDMNEFNN